MAAEQSRPAVDTRPVIISGPSGAGKSTILKRLFAEFPDRFGFSVSHTTRTPRQGEQDGREYHFTDHPTFEGMIARDAFVENAIFGGNRYGTSFAAVADVAAQGRVCILDIELEGVKQVDRLAAEGKLPFARPKFLFLAPPSVEVLEKRLRGRGTDTEEAIQKRLQQARVEMEFAESGAIHEKVVVNDDLDKAYKEVKDFVVGS
ncbi:Guanylate kinase [Neofusicoccum parvum]|uniref:Guanylate kinase n=2 Tax=Neofusicoccum parvum TaxID=310453 RepID=R1GI20_BOTPV|nr:putative guanylate kinase protein [Neofusicoccum parvum UCRNP2]GME34827.1 Guanylate kinase [Neofusicoccum parvum]GME53429.1 Guanylate kinase [Neofusicoccum parvum]